MTKGELQRERAGLKDAINQIYRLSTAHRRRGTPRDASELLADLHEIEQAAMHSLITQAKKGDR